MNPQYLILGAELVGKAMTALKIIHNSPHPKSLHDEISNIINAIQSTAKPTDLPTPSETIQTKNEN